MGGRLGLDQTKSSVMSLMCGHLNQLRPVYPVCFLLVLLRDFDGTSDLHTGISNTAGRFKKQHIQELR